MCSFFKDICMKLKLPIYLLITLLQIQSWGSENKSIVSCQSIPLELWFIIMQNMEDVNNILSAASFFYKIHKNINQQKSIERCKGLAQKHVQHNKYDAHLTKDYFSLNIFTPELKEKLSDHYNNYFASFFLKYGHKDKMYKEFIQAHSILKEKINIESKSYIGNTCCRHTIYSLKNNKTREVTIKSAEKLTEEMFNHLYYEYKNEKIVRILLSKNEKFPFIVDENMNKDLCPIIIQLRDGTTPLHYYMNALTKEENFRKVEFLIAHGADLEFHNAAGFTPLCFSFLNKKSLKLVDLLLRNGANPHAKPHKMYNTRTPLDFCLHYAPEKRELLLKYGAKEDKKNKQNKYFSLEDYEKNKDCLLLKFDELLEN